MSENENQSTNPNQTVPQKVQGAGTIPSPREQGEIQPANGDVSLGVSLEFVKWHHEYVRQQIVFADTKAAWFFAAETASLVYLIANFNPNFGGHSLWAALLLLLPFLFLVGSIFMSGVVVAPRLFNSNNNDIYFGKVAGYPSSNDYVAEVQGKGERQISTELIRHSYDLSKICAHKYCLIGWSFYLGVAAALATAAIVIFYPGYSLI